jgi:hypothetical protein
MTKPTGRPRGRPKTKESVTLMARVDVTLADRVKRYAAAHRQPISVVMRDALLLLMDEYPSSVDLAAPHRIAAHEFLADRYDSSLDTLLGETDSTGLEALLSDMKEEVIDTILEEANRRPDMVSDTKEAMADIASDSHTDRAEIRMGASARARARQMSDSKADPSARQPDSTSGRASMLSDRKRAVSPPGAAITSDTHVPAFDVGKYVLGKLCPRGHDYHGTGHSLRHRRRHVCVTCDAEQARARRKAQCQA